MVVFNYGTSYFILIDVHSPSIKIRLLLLFWLMCQLLGPLISSSLEKLEAHVKARSKNATFVTAYLKVSDLLQLVLGFLVAQAPRAPLEHTCVAHAHAPRAPTSAPDQLPFLLPRVAGVVRAGDGDLLAARRSARAGQRLVLLGVRCRDDACLLNVGAGDRRWQGHLR